MLPPMRSLMRWRSTLLRRRQSRDRTEYLMGLALARADRYLEELMEAAGDPKVTKLDLWTWADFARDGIRSARGYLG